MSQETKMLPDLKHRIIHFISFFVDSVPVLEQQFVGVCVKMKKFDFCSLKPCRTP